MEKLKRILGILLMLLGISVAGFAQLRNYFHNRTLRVQAGELTGFERIMLDTSYAPKPTAIRIGDGLIDTSIEEQQIVGGQWGLSQHAASYLVSSSRPTQDGNIIVYGHNTKEVFGNLLQVNRKNPILVQLSNGKVREYRIYFIREVKATDLQYLKPTKEEILTLYTCSGFMDQNRYIIRARPVK